MRRWNPLATVASLLLGLVALVPLGCQTPVQKAASIRASIQSNTDTINRAVDSAQGAIESADQKVVVIQRIPGVATQVVTGLDGVRTDLGSATSSLNKVHPATTQISEKAVEAEAVTKQAVDDLKKEQSQWFSFKMRHAFYTIAVALAGIGVIVGICLFLAKTTGVQPIVELFSSIAKDIGLGSWKQVKGLLSLAWTGLKKLGVAAWHTFTFGLSYLGDKVRSLVEAKKAAPVAKAATPAKVAPHAPVVAPALQQAPPDLAAVLLQPPHPVGGPGTQSNPVLGSTQGPLINLHQ